MRYAFTIVLICVILVSTLWAQSGRVRHFQIVSTHAEEQCATEHKRLEAAGTRLPVWLEWRCAYGNHSGHGVVEAENEFRARSMLRDILGNFELIPLGGTALERIDSLNLSEMMIETWSTHQTAH